MSTIKKLLKIDKINQEHAKLLEVYIGIKPSTKRADRLYNKLISMEKQALTIMKSL